MRKIFSFLKGKFVLERKNKSKNRIIADFSAVWFDDCTALFFSTKKEEKTIEISIIGNKCQFYTKSRAPPRSVWIRLSKFKLNGERILNINVNVNINVNFDSLEEFKKFCKVLYLEREYPNHLGNADWLIISDLSEEEIQRRFSEVLSKYIPYILVNSEVGEAILSSKRKVKQLQMADSRYLDCYDVTEPDFISYHRELIENNFEDFYILLQDVRLLNKYLNKLNPDQRRRLRKYYYDGKNYSQIAREEGVNHSTVRKSVKAGLKNLKKLFEKGCQ